MIRHTIKWATVLFSLYGLVVYCLVFFAFASNWIAGFMMMSLPVVYIMHIVLFIYWLLNRSVVAWIPAVILILGLVFLPRTYGFGERGEVIPDSDGKQLRVMNFNAHGFFVGPGKTAMQRKIIRAGLVEIKAWLLRQDADILCLPEFFSNKSSKPYDMNRFFADNGYPYRALLRKGNVESYGEDLGMAVFSRYPIVASKDVFFKDVNGIIAADVKVGNDTVRVVSIHLHSMTLRVNRIFEQKSASGVKYQLGTAYRRMKTGFIKRAEETGTLKQFYENCPYPVIVCGDFNETPYSYTYGQLRKTLANAFEEKGEGFGFTYNAMPNFIRIDNQFFDDSRLTILDFKTLNNVRFSDHYALTGTYRIKKKAD